MTRDRIVFVRSVANGPCKFIVGLHIVPMLRVGTTLWALCVPYRHCITLQLDAERLWLHSHAERGNDDMAMQSLPDMVGKAHPANTGFK